MAAVRGSSVAWGIAVAAIAILGVWGSGEAKASTWSVAKLPNGGIVTAFFGISCPTTELCVTVGGNNAIATSTKPAGGAEDWRVVYPDGGFVPPAIRAGRATAGASLATYNGEQIRGVSCPSTGLCVAASLDSQIYVSTDPTGPASAWEVLEMTAPEEPNIHMGGISCPSASLCVAVGLGGKLVTSTNPTGGRAAWSVTELAAPYDLRGVDCPSATLCVAVGNEGGILVSTDPTGGPAAWQLVGAPGGASSLNGVSCPSPSFCVTGTAGKIITSTDPTASAAWKVTSAGTGLLVKDVSCPSAQACAAIDNNADVMASTEPTGGASAWWFENVIPFRNEQSIREGIIERNGTYGISCPATSLCVGVGMEFQVIASKNPFERTIGSGERADRRARPRVVITGHPAKRLDPRKGGNRVRFRFRGIGEARRFACKLHGKGFAPCRSGVRYRVGRGKHVFRVRAIGPKGVKGPPASFHFRVGELTERPPVGSCPEGTEGSIRKPCVRA